MDIDIAQSIHQPHSFIKICLFDSVERSYQNQPMQYIIIYLPSPVDPTKSKDCQEKVRNYSPPLLQAKTRSQSDYMQTDRQIDGHASGRKDIQAGR